MRLALLSILALALTGCAATASGPPSLPAFTLDLAGLLDGTVPEAEVAAEAPVETAVRPNRHVEGAEDTYRTYLYRGVRVTYLYAAPVDRTFFLEVEVTVPGPRTPSGLGVGSPRAEVEAAYGDPFFEPSTTEAHYPYRDAEASESVTFVARYADDRVASFSVVHDVD